MPSFLSKVLGRKKEDKDSANTSSSPTSDPSLLGGKFERISPTVSPSAGKFSNVQATPSSDARKDKEKMKDGPFSLLRMKSKDTSSKQQDPESEAPQLSLFLEPEADQTLANALETELRTMTDADIARSRLTPKQALTLVQACSKAITDRGLETLGIMHPHWHSASPDTQRRLISLFLHSLVSKGPSTTVITASASSTFQSELAEVRSPHDVAAVLRWGVRHLELEQASFGEQEDWYKKFFESERDSGYPIRSYSQHLPPVVRTPHFELLTTLLDIVSSLASHAESNGISGSRLSKLIGLWLLTAQRAQKDDDWVTFYNRWDKYGRILEHLFLAYIRDEADKHQMPRRLTELVQSYPYNKSKTTSDDDLLPRPRFSTRRHHALHIQVATELSNKSPRPPRHPLVLIADAFKAAPPDSESDGVHADVWDNIRSAVARDGGSLQQVFSDETIRYLSLLPKQPGFDATQLGFFFDRTEHSGEDSASTPSQSLNGHGIRQSIDSSRPEQIPDALAIDWTSFSTSGFLDSSPPAPLAQTLLDKDVEKSTPTLPRSTSKRAKQRSTDPPSAWSSPQLSTKQLATVLASYTPKIVPLGVVPVDEAFVDFCSDAMFDPIASNWPSFTLCKLRSNIPGLDVEGKNVEYLVLERTIIAPPLPVLPPIQTTQIAADTSKSPTSPRATSPRPSLKAFSPSLKKRFSVWAKKNSGQASPKVDEQGALIVGEKEAPAAAPRASLNILKEEDAPAASINPTAVTAAAATGTLAATTAILASASDAKADPAVEGAAEPTRPLPDGEAKHGSVEATAEPASETTPHASDPADLVEAVPAASETVAEAPAAAPVEADLPPPVPTEEVKAVLSVIPAEDSQPPSEDATAPTADEDIMPTSQDLVSSTMTEVVPAEGLAQVESVSAEDEIPEHDNTTEADATEAPGEVLSSNTDVPVPDSPIVTPVQVTEEAKDDVRAQEIDGENVTILQPDAEEAELVPEVEDLVLEEDNLTAEPEVAIVQTDDVIQSSEDLPIETSNVHTEPIREPSPAPQDDAVSLFPVPIVDVDPTMQSTVSPPPVAGEIPIPSEVEEPLNTFTEPPSSEAVAISESAQASADSVLELGVEPVEDVPSTDLDAVVESGSTPAPQALLDSVIEPTTVPAVETPVEAVEEVPSPTSDIPPTPAPVDSQSAPQSPVAKEIEVLPVPAEAETPETAVLLSTIPDAEPILSAEGHLSNVSSEATAPEVSQDEILTALKAIETPHLAALEIKAVEDTPSPDTKPAEDAHDIKP